MKSLDQAVMHRKITLLGYEIAFNNQKTQSSLNTKFNNKENKK